MTKTLVELANYVGGEVKGDGGCVIKSVATLDRAGEGDVTFLANVHYRKLLPSTNATAVILSSRDVELCPVNAIVVADPYVGYAKVAGILNPLPTPEAGIHPSAVVDRSCDIAGSAHVGPGSVIGAETIIGERAYIGPGCVIGANSSIGDDTRLFANVTICCGSIVGQRVLVHPGVVIGSDGFGIANDGGRWIKVPQLGCVRVGNDVEIGANTTVDRGALDDTIIEDGVKLDNQIQVAHNVRIGAHTVIAGCVGIAGSAHIGKHCALAGGVGIVGHLQIADHVQVTGMSMVTKSISEPGVYSSGTPLQTNKDWHKNAVRFKQLDEMAKRLKALEKVLDGKD